MPLPPALFELYRFADGQEPQRSGPVQFVDAARLLSLREMLQATQDRAGPLETRRAFERFCHEAAGGGDGSSGDGASGSGCGCGGSESVGGEPPAVLLPFTGELRGRKRYCLDVAGRVWLASGFNVLPVEPTLPELLRRVLT